MKKLRKKEAIMIKIWIIRAISTALTFGLVCFAAQSQAEVLAQKTDTAIRQPTDTVDSSVSGPEGFRETALTETVGWAPADAVGFKGAEACYDVFRDEYAIAAIFTRRSAWSGREWDAVHLLRVDGNEGSANYGQLTHAMFVGSSTRIDHVDCTEDDGGRIYVTFDRYRDDVVWYRYDDTVRSGPYAVPPFEACFPITHMPRIAVSQGEAPTVLVAYEGYNFDLEVESCEACVRAFNALTGTPRPVDDWVWNDNMTHGRYDVEWNGEDRFAWALPYHVDAGTSNLGVYTYDVDGTRLDEHVIQNFFAEPDPAYPYQVELVYTDSDNNPNRRFVLITDQASTYWLRQDGSRYGSPRYGWDDGLGGPPVACEYLGASYNIAHSFHPFMRWVPGPHLFVLGTEHKHWKYYPTTPRDEYSLVDDGYFPAACHAGTPTLDEPELLLVSTWLFGPTVWWHFEEQH
jgi:hypothetical protein